MSLLDRAFGFFGISRGLGFAYAFRFGDGHFGGFLLVYIYSFLSKGCFLEVCVLEQYPIIAQHVFILLIPFSSFLFLCHDFQRIIFYTVVALTRLL